MRLLLRFVLGLLVSAAAARSAQAQLKAAPGDWPGWRGANRDNISKETGLLSEWPKEGPELVWKAKGLGVGYSTPSIAKGVVYVMGTEDKDDCVIALDIKDGSQLWSTPIIKAAKVDYPGPRSTPTIDGDTLYALTPGGTLISAKTSSGEINWRKDFRKEFKGEVGGWAYCESPLIDGDVLICTPGGNTACMVALDKRSGDVIWKSDTSGLPKNGKRGGNYTRAEYSSTIVANLQGVKQYVQLLNGGVAGFDAKTGQALWHYDRPASGTANISTPLQFGDGIFAATGYGNGGGLANIVKKDDGFEAEEVFFVKQMQNRNGGMVIVDNFLYGTNNRALVCLDMKTGKVAWQDECVGQGAVTYADGHIYVRSEQGPVALVEANPKAYKEVGRFKQPERSGREAWPIPVVAGGKLYLRDQGILLCYDVKGK
jgi:outer membrane protein assembly factor BamB